MWSHVPSVVLLLSLTSAAAQEPVAISAGGRNVVLDVVVRDRQGRLVRDLTASDLHVADAGAAIKSASVRLVTPGSSSIPGVAAPPRVITLLFERVGPDGRALAREGAAALVKAAAGPGVYFAVLSAGTSIEIRQEYTTDARLVQAAIDRITVPPRKKSPVRADDVLARLRAQAAAAPDASSPAPTLARILLNVTDPAVSGSRRDALNSPSLQVLAGLAREQSAVAGRKTLVYFCEGLPVPESQRRAFAEIIQTANRSNLSIYPVDVSGLDPEAPDPQADAHMYPNLDQTVNHALSMTSYGIGGARGELHRLEAPKRKTDENRGARRGTLADLAVQTGGFLVANTNGIAKPARRIAEEVATYYEVSYMPPEAPLDGQFRPVAVTVGRPGVVVQSPNGYLALPPAQGVQLQAFEIPLLKELDVRPSRHDFTHTAVLVPLRPAPGGVEHAVLVESLLGDLRFEDDRKAGACRAHGAALAVVRDGAGKIVDRFSLDNPFQGPIERKDSYRMASWLMEDRVVLAPGAYTLETVVADVSGQRASVERRNFTVEPWAAGPHVAGLTYVRSVLAAKRGFRRVFQTSDKVVEPQVGLNLASGPGSVATVFFLASGDGGTAPGKAEVVVLSNDAGELARGSVYEGSLAAETALLAKLDTSALPAGEYRVGVEITQNGKTSRASLPLTVRAGAAPTAGQPGSRLAISSKKAEDWDSSPPNAEQQRLIEAARNSALGYAARLPNFVCLQTTRRLEDPTGAQEWREKDEYSEVITWRHGVEEYGQVAGRGRPRGKRTGKVRVTSAGEFGSLLRTIFLPESKAVFRWVRSESMAGRRTGVFSYRIEAADSQYHINYLGKHAYHATPAYHGLVNIDADTAEVLHLETDIGDLPDPIKVVELHITVDYDIANVAGQDVLLPSSATLMTRVGERHLVPNEMRFTGFRRFDADTSIRYGAPSPTP